MYMKQFLVREYYYTWNKFEMYACLDEPKMFCFAYMGQMRDRKSSHLLQLI